MKIVKAEKFCFQNCRACTTMLEIHPEDVITEAGWFHYRCIVCRCLNEMENVPQKFYDLILG